MEDDSEEFEIQDIHKVDVNSVIHEESRTFGGEWLSKQMLDGCGLSGHLSQNTDNKEIEKLMEAEIILRMVHPSSEPKTSRWLAGESSLCEILSLQKMPGHLKLYDAARRLHAQKEEVEDFLYQRFASKYPDRMRLCLYDLTNFYFEGRKEHSTLARFGRSREKAPRRQTGFISSADRRSGFYPPFGNIHRQYFRTVHAAGGDFRTGAEQYRGRRSVCLQAGGGHGCRDSNGRKPGIFTQ